MPVLAAERGFSCADPTLAGGVGRVRGIDSHCYVSVALGLGILSVDEARSPFWTVDACVVASILVHAVTATPLGRRLRGQSPP